jgi:hypothetical protein
LWKRPAFEQERIAESVLEEEAVNAELSSENDGGYDNRLYTELQQSRQHTHTFERRKRTGSLALAAGWGLFLCAASGLIVGFLNFRDILADALPGLAPVYRTLGLPITVQSLVFEGVQYEWKMSGGRPALLIKGAVYNRAQRKVKIPAFFITIKDQNAEFDKEYPASLNVNGSKIRAGQKAEFEIELLSPRPTMKSVELELRNVH